MWRLLGQSITPVQRNHLENLLTVPEGRRGSWLDKLRSGPTRISAPALIQALLRIQTINKLGISLPTLAHIPPSRLTSLARFAMTAKITAISRLPPERRLATLIAFIHCLKATAHDDALDVLDMLLRDLFNRAMREDKKKRLRTIKDLDQAAILLVKACQIFLDRELPDAELRQKLFEKIPQEALEQAVKEVGELVRPPDNVYFQELTARYRHVRRFFLPLLKWLRFDSNSAGKPVIAALDWLRTYEIQKKPLREAPKEVVRKPWQRYVFNENGKFDFCAYTFCVLDELQVAIRRRDVFVHPSWRYADPRSGLLTDIYPT